MKRNAQGLTEGESTMAKKPNDVWGFERPASNRNIYVTWNMTHWCNFHCSYCFQHDHSLNQKLCPTILGNSSRLFGNPRRYAKALMNPGDWLGAVCGRWFFMLFSLFGIQSRWTPPLDGGGTAATPLVGACPLQSISLGISDGWRIQRNPGLDLSSSR